jgi:hypothetical protein
MYRLDDGDQSANDNAQNRRAQRNDERISKAREKIQITIFSDKGLFKRFAQIIPKSHSVA